VIVARIERERVRYNRRLSDRVCVRVHECLCVLLSVRGSHAKQSWGGSLHAAM
jgi:hypothetical protein